MKMIQGARALAAALGGAEVHVITADGWQPSAYQEAAKRTWRRRHDRSDDGVNVFAVRAADARRVLG